MFLPYVKHVRCMICPYISQSSLYKTSEGEDVFPIIFGAELFFFWILNPDVGLFQSGGKLLSQCSCREFPGALRLKSVLAKRYNLTDLHRRLDPRMTACTDELPRLGVQSGVFPAPSNSLSTQPSKSFKVKRCHIIT